MKLLASHLYFSHRPAEPCVFDGRPTTLIHFKTDRPVCSYCSVAMTLEQFLERLKALETE